MTTLTRRQAHDALTAAGWPASMLNIMTAIGAQESSLRVGVTSPKNADGTEDYGWLQINSIHVDGPPNYDKEKLLTDPVYNARAALDIYRSQSLHAWVAYKSGDYIKFMPPPVGVALAQGSKAWFLVVDLQSALNAWLKSQGRPLLSSVGPRYGVDGDFGPKTEAALVKYQLANPVEPRVAGPHYWNKLVPK